VRTAGLEAVRAARGQTRAAAAGDGSYAPGLQHQCGHLVTILVKGGGQSPRGLVSRFVDRGAQGGVVQVAAAYGHLLGL
jgi:hypothetical protein